MQVCLTLAPRDIWRLVHPIHVVKQNLLFFLANTIASAENPTKQLPFSLSAGAQTGANAESSVKRKAAAKTVILC